MFNFVLSSIRFSVADPTLIYQAHPMQQNYVTQHVVDPSQSVLFSQGPLLIQQDLRQQQYFTTTAQPTLSMSYPGSECEYSAPVSEVEFPVGSGPGAHLWNLEPRPTHLSIGVLPQTFPASFLPMATVSPNPSVASGGFGYLTAAQPECQPLTIASLNLQAPQPAVQWSTQALSPAINGSLIPTSEKAWSPIYPAHQNQRHFESLNEQRTVNNDSNVPPRFRKNSSDHRVSPPAANANQAVNDAMKQNASYELRDEDFPEINSGKMDLLSKNPGKSVAEPRNGCNRDRAVQTRKSNTCLFNLYLFGKGGRRTGPSED